MHTHRLRGNRDDLTALHWSNLLVVEQGFSSAPPIHKIKRPAGACLFYGGWGGIRTPGGVAPTTVFKTVAIDRSATHPKLFSAGLSNLRFCSLFAPGGAAHHSFALDCAALVLLTRMQDRRNRPRLSPIRNCFPPVFQTYGFVRCSHLTVLLTTRSRSTALRLSC